MYLVSRIDDHHHVIAAINIDFSFGFEPFSNASLLNKIFFDDKPVFFPEQNRGYGQMGLFNLMDSSVCHCLGQRQVQIWNFRGNALIHMDSKQMQLILQSATSIIVYVNENCDQNKAYMIQTINILKRIKSAIGNLNMVIFKSYDYLGPNNMTIIFPSNCKQYACPNMIYISTLFPESRLMCTKLDDASQKRILRAEMIGNMFQNEPKLRLNDFSPQNNSAGNVAFERERSVNAEIMVEDQTFQQANSQSNFSLNRNQVQSATRSTLKLKLSKYQLMYHQSTICNEFESYSLIKQSIDRKYFFDTI